MLRFPQLPALQHGRFFATFKFPGSFSGLQCNGESWFKVALPTGGSISVKITFRNTDGDLDLYLFDEAAHVLAASESTSDSEQVTKSALAAGNYYVKVVGYNGASATFAMTIQTNGTMIGSVKPRF